MSVTVTAVYEGELHTSARHEPSSSSISTDAPVDNEGRGECFSPTDLVGTALGTCMLTIMGILARRHGWALEGARVTVVKEMAVTPPRRIGRLDVAFSMPAGLDPAARTALERAAMECPVHRSLHPDVCIDIRFEYPQA